ncbi:MAG: leucine-rich repeat domain-containing protein [Calditrichaeota bacterium]|nr:MAG: leucine-rich repeat domain-containing protein [Calditrichota bacterium]MBL1204129.1 leucine-rich repeat domain-containing protein [Calditrichota bacterium]NOG43960.1 hypothetical protein [Calditrichota bacterium]
MKKLYIILAIIFLFHLSCENQSVTPSHDTNLNEGTMEISLDMSNAPPEVFALTGILSNSNGVEISFDFELSGNSATALVENIPVGDWVLQVNAIDAENTIIYSGSTEVKVSAGVVTTISLHLNPTTGSLQIIVTWGNDYINIPDENLLNALIEASVDIDGDGLISKIEAEATTTLIMRHRNISDLTGLEAFINLETLDCSYNLYSSIDVSKMKDLVYLDCSESRLNALDVTNNLKLEHLDCSDYRIPKLDVSNNPELVYLNCHNNLIKELDLSNNTKLEVLWTQENQLTYLDLSNNKSLKEISLHSIPTLVNVCVWVLPFPPAGVNLDKYGSPNIKFTTDCLQDDQFEENDELSNAAPLTEFTYYHDLFISINDDDWYSMTISADSLSIKCDFIHTDGDINIDLVDKNGNVLATSQGSTDNERINHIVSSLETYYIHVYQVSGTNNTYTIWWDDIWQGEGKSVRGGHGIE